MKSKTKTLPACTDEAQTTGDNGAISPKNILMPLAMLIKAADLLSYWDISSYDFSIQCEYDDVMSAITKKIHAIELRNAYTKVVCAKDDDDRFFARLEYLKLRREIHE